MSKHEGRDEVLRRRKRVEMVFRDLAGAQLSAELVSHYSRYLSVLVSGYAEQSVKELVTDYCRHRAEVRIQRYLGTQLKRLQNIDLDKLRQLVQSFDPQWWEGLQLRRLDELEAFDSVTSVRNSVSHGGDSGITISTISQYFEQVSKVLDDLCDLFDPVGTSLERRS